ncbi:MAG: hypothetical protein KBB52_06765 [Candidatus Omnitrophica bacterium]|nr:hypothetical protein [Candidatus Omnitrophota bacterium]
MKERRQYIRLNSVFPVTIYLKKESGPQGRPIQAFTHDVSLGGLCLYVNDPDSDLINASRHEMGSFEINIDIPFTSKPVEARVKPAWHELKDGHRHKKLVMGVSYEKIDPRANARIMSRARRMKWLPRIAVFSIIILMALLTASFYESYSLKMRNTELINRFYKVQDTSEIYKRSFSKIEEQYAALKLESQKNEEKIASLQKELDGIGSVSAGPETETRKTVLLSELKDAEAEKGLLDKELSSTLDKREKTGHLLDEVRQRRQELEGQTVKNMYQWLKTHQNKSTGLMMSFEGDQAVKDWAFTYDQSLALQTFMLFNDTERAENILLFYRDKAARRDKAFMNAYNANSMSPTEDLVRSGPTIWIGIAALQYAKHTQDRSFLSLAEDVAGWVISMKDREGGLKGGKDVTWYSTEHNLDAYALFNMLYEMTKKDLYCRERDSTLKWIKENTYSEKDGGMRRGKGDATIATDTMSWAIAAIGPAVLSREGMDPDGIIKFAEDNCVTTTMFTRSDGSTVSVRGFDFAKSANAPRGGVISTEWTAQMALAFKIMADYYFGLGDSKKSQGYLKKYEDYLSELDKMIISSPSPSGQGAGCLPYASQPGADTGHGWRTPAGAHTGSVSATAYAIFAKRGFNPLSLE